MPLPLSDDAHDDDLHLFHDSADAHVIPAHVVHRAMDAAVVAETYAERIVHVMVTLYALAKLEIAKRPELHIVAVVRIVVGVLLCFFGCLFSSVAAIVEAFHAGGGQQVRDNLHALHEAVQTVKVNEDGTHIRIVRARAPSRNSLVY